MKFQDNGTKQWSTAWSDGEGKIYIQIYIYKKKMFCFEMSTFAFWIKTWIVYFKTKIAHDDHKQNWWTITDTSSQSDL